ncbi:MAG: hypothetical protein ACI978_001779 [Oleispira sp.]|jgi:hypothetical protein
MINFFSQYKLLFLSLVASFLIACGGGSGSAGASDSNTELVSESLVTQEVFLDEGDEGTASLIFTFTADATRIIKYSSYDIDAVAKSDYQEITGSLSVIQGESYSIILPIFSDTRIEADEKVGVLLTDVNDNKLSTFIGTLVNDDFPTVSVSSVSITEGDVGNQVLRFTITLSAETVAPFPVSILTVNKEGVGYADPANDFTPVDFDVVFYSGQLVKTIEVEIFGDADIEPDEIIYLTASYAGITTEPVAGVIRTDDFPGNGAPTFEVNRGRSLLVAENTTNTVYQMPFSINDDGGFTEPFVLNYYLLEYRGSGTGNTADLAKIDADFETSLAQITITPGQIDYVAEFSILDDLSLENVEILEFILANDAGVEFGSGRIYISDNEAPVFNIYRKYNNELGDEVSSTELIYAESSASLGEHNIYIEMSDPVGYDYEFEYILRLPNNGEVSSPVDSNDFVSAVVSTEIESKVLTILNGNVSPAGNSAYAIDFKINDDTSVEGHESFFIELRNGNGTLIGDAVEVKIINDDIPEITWQADNAESFVGGVVRFMESIPLDSEGDLGLGLVIDNGNGVGAPALEDYALTVTRSVVLNGSCGWRADSELSDEEFLITNAGKQVFSKSATRFSLNATSVDDEQVECDEYIELSATLASQIAGIEESRSNTINLVSVNDDQAFLDIYGFDVSETEGTTDFQIKMNADISLEAGLILTSLDAEKADASFEFGGISLDVNSATASAITFEEGIDDETQVINVSLTDDHIVELSESYTLTLSLGASAGLPIGLRYCQLGLMPECSDVASPSTSASVNGIIHSDDQLALSIAVKTSDTVLESDLTALNLINNDVQFPFQVSLSNEVASDVPNIELALSDQCLLLATNDCATSNDFEISNTLVHTQGAQTYAGNIDLGLKLLVNDEVVEPDEIVKIAISLNDAISLQTYVPNWSNQDISYNILNDDKLTFNFSAATAPGQFEQDTGSQTSGIAVSWDKEIAQNIATINFSISETCDELNNAFCIVTNTLSGSIDGDIQAPVLINVHTFGASTLSTITPLDLGVKVVGDTSVEPNEIVQLTVGLENENLFSEVLSTAWANWTTDFTIYNDDTFMPTIGFTSVAGTQVGNVFTASGNESISNIGITLGWTENISSNVTDIDFVIESICVAEYAAGSSYSVKDCDSLTLADISHDTGYQLINKTSGQVADLNFSILDNDVVEPNELVTITIALGTTPSHYFTDVSAFPSLEYRIVNDDVLGISFNGHGTAVSEGDSVNTDLGLSASWTNDIASNVPPITLSISEVCDNAANNHCIADTGDLSMPSSVIIHSGSSSTVAGSRNFDVKVVGDLMVEPNELVDLAISYNNAGFLSDYLASNVISNIGLTVNNDDVISPVITFNDLTTSGNGLETNSGNDSVGVKLTWGSQVIADNTDDLNFIITDSCVSNNPLNTSCESSDYTLTSMYSLINQPSLGSASLAFNISGDEVVEPSETISIGLVKDSNTPNHYFPSVGYVFPTINYTITNDDKIAPYFITATSTGNEGSTTADAGIKVGWDQDIAANVPDLAITVASSCVASGCVVGEDFNFTASESVSVFTTGSDKAAPGATGETLNFKIVGDAMVEPSEDVTLTLGSTDTDYVEFASTPSHTRTITNDDKVTPYFIGSAAALDEGLSGQTSANVKITWDEVIAANVPTLDVSVLSACASSGCTLAQDINYGATESLTIFTTGTEKSSPGITGQSVGLSITGDALVEPSEVVNLSLSSAASPYIDTTANPSFAFTITNDDRVTPYFVATTSTVVEGDLGTTAAPVKVTWDQDIAANVSSLNLSIDASCVANGCDPATDSNLGSTKSLSIFTTGSDLASPGASGIDVGLLLTADEVVEPDEVLTLTLTLVDSNYVDVSSSKTHAVTIDNDDKIAPYFTTATSNGNEGSTTADAGIKVGWDQDIAANVPDLAITVASSCAASGCVVGEDFNFTASESVSVFTTGSDKAAPGATGETLNFKIVGDAMVEPSEDVTLTLGSTDTDYVEFASTPSHTRTITNDDKVTPYFIGSAAALDEGLSGQTSANVKITWDEVIAANVPTLDVSVLSACASSGCTLAQDINYGATESLTIFTTGTEKSSPGITGQSVGLSITGDALVEPSEVVNLSLSSAASPYIDTTANPSFAFTITNDDRVTPYFVATTSTVVEGDLGTTAAPVKVTWDQDIAANVSSLNLSIDASCVANGCDPATDSNLGSTKSLSIFTTGSDLASPGASGIDVGLLLTADEVVEPDEVLTLTLTLVDSNYVDVSSSKTHAVTIDNDDKIAPYFTTATSNGNEGSTTADAGIKVGWDQDIAANVPDLAITVASSCAASGCVVGEDFNFTASESVSVFTTGSDKAAPGATGETLNFKIVGDAMVEPSEDVTLTLGSTDTDYVEFASTPSHTRTITNDDTLSISVADVSVLESAAANITFVWSETVAKNVPAFDIAIAMACDDLSASSTCNMTGFDDFTAQTTVSLRTNGEVADIAGGNVLLNVPLVNDSSVEPTEVIAVGFTIPPAIQPYFSAATISDISLSILNDDYVEVSYAAGGADEADGNVSLQWSGYRVEGFSEVSFQLNTGISSQLGAAAAATSDYTIGGTLCNASGVCSLAITAEALSATNEQTITFVGDDIIELDEAFSISLTASSGSAPIAAPASASSDFVITNDDFLTFSLDYGTHTSSGSVIAAGPSIMIDENQLADIDGQRLNLIACNASSQNMQGGDLVMDVTYSTQGHKMPVISDRIVNASVADDILASVSTVTVTGNAGCSVYPLITQFVNDDVVEAHEWFAISVAPDSSDPRCINSAQCMGQSTGLDDDGLVVIANDDFNAFADSGNDQCLDATGNLAAYDNVLCSPAGQDVEVDRVELSFVPLTSEGYPTLEQEHVCVSQGSTGYVWARYGLSASVIPEVSAAEVSWAWSGGTNDAATRASVNQALCGKTEWLMPELDELVAIADLDWLNSDVAPFNHNDLTSMAYWASQACYVDGDGATLGHYAFSYLTGTSQCLVDTSELHIRMLAK